MKFQANQSMDHPFLQRLMDMYIILRHQASSNLHFLCTNNYPPEVLLNHFHISKISIRHIRCNPPQPHKLLQLQQWYRQLDHIHKCRLSWVIPHSLLSSSSLQLALLLPLPVWYRQLVHNRYRTRHLPLRDSLVPFKIITIPTLAWQRVNVDQLQILEDIRKHQLISEIMFCFLIFVKINK